MIEFETLEEAKLKLDLNSLKNGDEVRIKSDNSIYVMIFKRVNAWYETRILTKKK